MNEPPSRLDVEVFDFDGPFVEPSSLGHAEINFLKTSVSDLSDVWIPLQGKLSQACQSKIHLRIFLNSTKATNSFQEYIAKVEKEVGKKVPSLLVYASFHFNLTIFSAIYFFELITQVHEILVDKITVSSDKFNIPEAFWVAPGGISHQ